MKTYLCFNVDGTITKLKFKSNNEVLQDNTPSILCNYINKENENNNNLISSFIEYKYKNYIYYVCYNKNSNEKHNLCKLPFLDVSINGEYYVFKFDNELNMLNFTENQVYKILDIKIDKNIDDSEYSSDDFD